MDTHSVGDALDRVVRERAARAASGDLVEDIRSVVARTEQRRPARHWLIGGAMPRIVGVAGLAAAAIAVIVGVAILSSRPSLPGAGSGPSATPEFPQFACLSRRLNTGPGNLDLTGSWYDHANLYYLHQVGTTIWGVGINGPDLSATPVDPHAPYLAIHGTIDGTTVRVDWVSAGQRYPGETRFGPSFDGAVGTMTWQIGTGTDGNVQLTTTNETGTPLSGPAFRLPVLTPCTPAIQ